MSVIGINNRIEQVVLDIERVTKVTRTLKRRCGRTKEDVAENGFDQRIDKAETDKDGKRET